MSAFVLGMGGLLMLMGIAAVWLTVRGIRHRNKTPWGAGGTYYGSGGGCSGGSGCGGGSSGGGCGGGSSCGGGSCGGGGGCGGGGN